MTSLEPVQERIENSVGLVACAAAPETRHPTDSPT